jgi:hypothetical protein
MNCKLRYCLGMHSVCECVITSLALLSVMTLRHSTPQGAAGDQFHLEPSTDLADRRIYYLQCPTMISY